MREILNRRCGVPQAQAESERGQWRREAAEKETRQAKHGLWADPNPDPPWAFRRQMSLGP